jgi:hypothetical protein
VFEDVGVRKDVGLEGRSVVARKAVEEVLDDPGVRGSFRLVLDAGLDARGAAPGTPCRGEGRRLDRPSEGGDRSETFDEATRVLGTGLNAKIRRERHNILGAREDQSAVERGVTEPLEVVRGFSADTCHHSDGRGKSAEAGGFARGKLKIIVFGPDMLVVLHVIGETMPIFVVHTNGAVHQTLQMRHSGVLGADALV